MASETEHLRSRAGDRHLVHAALSAAGPADLVELVCATLLTHSRVTAALEDLCSTGRAEEVRNGAGILLWKACRTPRRVRG